MTQFFESLARQILDIPDVQTYGRVRSIHGLLVTVNFHANVLALGSRCLIECQNAPSILAEVIGFDDTSVIMMPFGDLMGIRPGARVYFLEQQPLVYPHISWLGRVINAIGEPIDRQGALLRGNTGYPIHGAPLVSHQRTRVEWPLSVGVRAINTFLTLCQGQRMGIFAGSGVGKSMLMSMLARYTECDVCVIGLVGERGREVKEFIENALGEEGLKRSIMVVATSDEPALMRREAAYFAITLAEYFRDQGMSVLCMIDSVTRFAMAQREIGLSAGEPPTTKGYTPTVFAELPKLLERAGPGIEDPQTGKAGTITGIFTVLVDGDDHNEPIADAARGILDGHIVLERAIAERGHFPAINILRSVSRMVPACHSEEQNKLVRQARSILATYEDMADMIRLGAYRKGSSTEVDRAMDFYPKIMEFLAQDSNEETDLIESFQRLEQVLQT
jgi:flagellum-specific ATP synthase